MPQYIPVAVFALDGTFLAYTIARSDLQKLQTTNLYPEPEWPKCEDQVKLLNADVDIKQYWPHPQDPEVLAILADATFMPIEYKTAEVVDDDRSYYAWEQVNEVDEYGTPTGRTVDGETIDQNASVLVYKTAKVPVAPAHEMLRIKNACEVVARRRAGV